MQDESVMWQQLSTALAQAPYRDLTEAEVAVVREIWDKMRANAGMGDDIADQAAFMSQFDAVPEVHKLELVGFVEWYLYSRILNNTWGGALNGQQGRQAMYREITGKVKFKAMVETGTYLGNTAEFMAKTASVPVFTTERHPRYFAYARSRLRSVDGVIAVRDDSRAFLARLAKDPFFPKERVMFYLDAHWGDDLPLVDEVALIARNWSYFVIMIDDFQVPDDHGYGYDAYDNGKTLCLDYLSLGDLPPLQVYWPALPSDKETSARRGCIVLAKDGVLERTGQPLQTLRPG